MSNPALTHFKGPIILFCYGPIADKEDVGKQVEGTINLSVSLFAHVFFSNMKKKEENGSWLIHAMVSVFLYFQ